MVIRVVNDPDITYYNVEGRQGHENGKHTQGVHTRGLGKVWCNTPGLQNSSTVTRNPPEPEETLKPSSSARPSSQALGGSCVDSDLGLVSHFGASCVASRMCGTHGSLGQGSQCRPMCGSHSSHIDLGGTGAGPCNTDPARLVS